MLVALGWVVHSMEAYEAKNDHVVVTVDNNTTPKTSLERPGAVFPVLPGGSVHLIHACAQSRSVPSLSTCTAACAASSSRRSSGML